MARRQVRILGAWKAPGPSGGDRSRVNVATSLREKQISSSVASPRVPSSDIFPLFEHHGSSLRGTLDCGKIVSLGTKFSIKREGGVYRIVSRISRPIIQPDFQKIDARGVACNLPLFRCLPPLKADRIRRLINCVHISLTCL